MAALIDIVNRALGHLGAEPLVNLDQVTPLAAKIKFVWPGVRDDVLRDHMWKCCLGRAVLPRLADAPVWGFLYSFQLPNDFLRLVTVEPDVHFQVEGGQLLTNAPDIRILYTRRESDIMLYDAQLCSVLALKLASELAYGVTGSTSLARSVEELYQQKVREAKGVDAREADIDISRRPSSWVQAKLGG